MAPNGDFTVQAPWTDQFASTNRSNPMLSLLESRHHQGASSEGSLGLTGFIETSVVDTHQTTPWLPPIVK